MADIMKVFLLALAAFVGAENQLTRRSNCEPLLQCQTPVYHVNPTNPFSFMNNSVFESACAALNTFQACVDTNKGQCDNATVIAEKERNVTLIQFYCGEQEKQGVDEFHSQSCSTDYDKITALNESTYFCYFHLRGRSNVDCCELISTMECVQTFANYHCGGWGGYVFAAGYAIYKSGQFTDTLCNFQE